MSGYAARSLAASCSAAMARRVVVAMYYSCSIVHTVVPQLRQRDNGACWSATGAPVEPYT